MALDPETQRAIQEITAELRELTIVMRNLSNTIAATADEQIHRLGKTTQKTSNKIDNANKLLDQFGREIKSSTEVVEDETKARREATEATKETTEAEQKAQREAFVYRRRERSAFRDLAQELSTSRGMMSRFQESMLGFTDQRFGTRYQAGLLLAGASLEALGRSAASLARTLYAGQIDIKGFSVSFEQLAKEAGTAALALGAASLLLGPFRILGAVVAVVGVGLKLLGSVLGLLTEQAKQQIEAFRDLQKVGGALGTTTDEMLASANKLGLGINELEKFTSLVGQNANTLAIFRGSVASGAREFSNLGAVFKRTGLRQQFLNMGMRLEDISEGMLGYLEIQTRNSRIETKTQGQLVKGMQAYLLETNRLTALTGKSRQEQEEQVRGAYAIEQFQYRISQLRQENTEESIAEANRLTEIFKTISSVGGPGLAQAMAEMTNGFVTSSNSIGAFLLSNAEAMRIMRDPAIGAAEAVDRLREILGKELQQGALGGLAAFGQFNAVTGQSYEELTRFVIGARQFGERTRTLTDTQADQITQGDKLVKGIVAMEEANRNSRDMMQQFINRGVVPATDALARLAKTVERLLRFIGLGNSDQPRGVDPATGGRNTRRGRRGSAASGSQMSAGPDSVLDFQGGMSGNRENFDRLDPGFRKRILHMAQAYTQATGRAMPFYSGHRTSEQNQAVGGALDSRHLQGMAADLGRGTVADLKRLGLLDKHGLKAGSSGSHVSDTGLRRGGVVSGPKSGYTSLLHGTEAVVPLPDNRSIPVEMPNFDRSLQAQTDMMSAQLSRLDEVVVVMRSQLGVSQRILQVSQG